MNQNAQLEKIQAELARIIHMVDELKTEENLGNDIDLEEIYRQAGAKAWTGHVITSGDEMTKRSYLSVLMGCAGLAGQMERKTGQYYFVARILRGVSDKLTMEELLQESRLLNGKVYEHLREALSEEQIQALLLDLCVMVSMTGEIEERQQIFLGECFAMFGVSKEQIRNLLVVAKGVLRQEYSQIYDHCNKLPAVCSLHYFKDLFPGIVVQSLEDIPKNPVQNIVVIDIDFDQRILEIDKLFQASRVSFLGCTFSKVSQIAAINTECCFYGCNFLECKNQDGKNGSRALIYLKKEAQVGNCKFYQCENKNHSDASVVLWMNAGEIENCVFENCEVIGEEAQYSNYAAILFAENAEIKNCRFRDCVSLGGLIENDFAEWFMCADCFKELRTNFEGDKSFYVKASNMGISLKMFWKNIVYMKKSIMKFCVFEHCKSSIFLINTENGCVSNTTYTECEVAKNTGNIRWKI